MSSLLAIFCWGFSQAAAATHSPRAARVVPIRFITSSIYRPGSCPRPLRPPLTQECRHAFAKIVATVSQSDEIVDIVVAQPGLQPPQGLLGDLEGDGGVASHRAGHFLGPGMQGGG